MKPKKAYHPSSGAAGLTLTELLVVILILVTLATISMFAISRLKHQAYSTKSVANLRQFGASLLGFAAENGGRLPNIGSWAKPDNPPPNVSYPVSWDGYLFPYLGLENEAVGKVPNDFESLFVHRNDKRTNPDTYCRRTYAMFRAVGDRGGKGWEGGQFTPLSKATDPSRVGLLTERPWGGGNAGTPSFADVSDATQMRPHPENGKDLNPGGKFNIVFADGHIQALLPKETIGKGTLQKPLGIWTFDTDD